MEIHDGQRMSIKIKKDEITTRGSENAQADESRQVHNNRYLLSAEADVHITVTGGAISRWPY